MIRVEQVTKSYPIKDGTVLVLKNISFAISNGLTFITGKSGSGKSTLLNILGGIDESSSGKVYYDGEDVSKYSETEWAIFRKKKVGFIFQSFNLLEHLTALENVEVSLMLAGVGRKKRKKRARMLLKKVHMLEFQRHRPGELSGGQKQRIAIARALANNPDVILADEPTGALDTKNSDEVMAVLKEISESTGKKVIVITHSKKYFSIANQIVELKDGEIKNNQIIKENINQNQTENVSNVGCFLIGSTFKLAISNMKKRRKRTIITAFGTSIGIFGILMIMFLVTGLNKRMNVIATGRVSEKTLLVSNENKKLSPVSDQKKIASLNDVTLVYETNRFNAQLEYEGNKIQSQAISIAPNKEDVAKNYADFGEPPLNANEMAISDTFAKKLFSQSDKALDKKIVIQTQLIASDPTDVYPVESKEYTITGIFKDEKEHQSEIEISYLSGKQLMQNNTDTENLTQYFTIVPRNINRVNVLKEQLQAMNYSSDDNMLLTGKKYLTIARNILIVLSSISLIVSMLLICVVLYISVTERTKEIGIIKTLGATPKDVKRLFLIEGGLLGFLGGMIGLTFALLISQTLNLVIEDIFKTIDFHFFSFNVIIILSLLVISIGIGLLAAYFPARSAGKKIPLKSLRY